mmetsp:Transcript_32756/g.49371  ORF Transcript_32756/g.49371 Transcript_32756/m.49371 type:complete len:98 (+) Transcript_32756:883-1176(+)
MDANEDSQIRRNRRRHTQWTIGDATGPQLVANQKVSGATGIEIPVRRCGQSAQLAARYFGRNPLRLSRGNFGRIPSLEGRVDRLRRLLSAGDGGRAL